MKADVPLTGDTLEVVVENLDRKFDGVFALTFKSPVDTILLVSQLRELANQIEDYASQFPGSA